MTSSVFCNFLNSIVGVFENESLVDQVKSVIHFLGGFLQIVWRDWGLYHVLIYVILYLFRFIRLEGKLRYVESESGMMGQKNWETLLQILRANLWQ